MRGRGGARGGRAPSAPWSRLKPVELDPLESMGLPSKGDNRYVHVHVHVCSVLVARVPALSENEGGDQSQSANSIDNYGTHSNDW